MAYITSVETQSLTVGECAIPPIAGIEAWPSLDPQAIASFHNVGMHLGEGILNQLGLANTVGLLNKIGINNALGLNIGVGGQVKAEPVLNNAAIGMAFSSPAIIQTTPLDSKKLFENGTSVCTAPCSDINAKKNIVPLENSLDKVLNLKGVSFDWDENVVPNKSSNESRQIGLIAQEVEQVVPEVVRNEFVENQTLKSVRYENLVALLIEGMKEQQEQINSLKETVQELSTKLAECCP